MSRLKSFWSALNTPYCPETSSTSDLCRLTPDAQEALSLAGQEANRLKHAFVGTEHVLLGLIALGRGVAVSVLKQMGVLQTVRLEIEKQIAPGVEEKSGRVPYTPRVKTILALAAKEARALNHTYVGTEDILLGLLREGDGVAARVLTGLGINHQETLQYVLRELNPNANSVALPAPMMSGQKPPENAAIDFDKRYDIYCREGDEEVIHRNALFGGSVEFIAIEKSDGQVVLVPKASIEKFEEHKPDGGSPGSAPKSD